ncbi:MAG: LptA/OstA family protein [Pseudomonadales bacterium]
MFASFVPRPIVRHPITLGLVCWLSVSVAGAIAADAAPAVDTPIHIRADKAWEEGDVLYLSGAFHMHTADWDVRSDQAEVHGNLESPDEIIGIGAPATIRVRSDSDGTEGLGQAERIVYRYAGKLLELRGNASLELDKVSVKSDAIVWDVANKRLVSTGDQGVEFVLHQVRSVGAASAEAPSADTPAPSRTTAGDVPPTTD